MRKPEFITFTGLDGATDLRRACRLADRYPIEYAVLLSASRQGKHRRYPDKSTIDAINRMPIHELAFHVCGSWADDVVAKRDPEIPFSLHGCQRIQVNHHSPNADAIRRFASSYSARGIAQSRGDYPRDTQIDWLFDTSGGNGVTPASWPAHPGFRKVGYAGGITPDNVQDVIAAIMPIGVTGPYWLDMETGVRTDDWFDLDKVEAVCRAVWGER